MIYICADDYGLTKKSCERIEDCALSGALNKISVFPNFIKPDMEKLSGLGVYSGLHINLVEGRAMSDAKDIPLLADENGIFKHSFPGLFLLSVSHRRKEFVRQLEMEICAQIEFWQKIGGSFFIDTHQHVHMIPQVFKTLLKAIEDKNVQARYLRFPDEPITPYLKCPSLYFTYSPVNLAKQLTLGFLALFNKRKLRKSGIKTALFMGIMFSGKMDKTRVEKVLKHYVKTAEKKKSDIEVLFHPGYMLAGEEHDFSEKFGSFYYSDGRKTEYETLKNLDI